MRLENRAAFRIFDEQFPVYVSPRSLSPTQKCEKGADFLLMKARQTSIHSPSTIKPSSPVPLVRRLS